MKSKVYIIFLFFVLAINTKSLAQAYTPNTWDAVNSTSVPGRYLGATFTIGTIIYYGTGTETGLTTSTDFWGYNTQTNTWISLASFPGAARVDAVGFSINGKGYMGLGDNGTTNFYDMYQYNPSTNTWSTITSLPTSAGGTNNDVGFTINGFGYVGLGSTVTGSNTTYLYQYNPTANTWSPMASLPGPARGVASAFVIDSIAYVGMGANGSGPLNDFYSYNPSTNTWTTIPSFPGTAADAAVAFSICGYGYVGMGNNSSDFYQYNPTANTWSPMNNFPGIALNGTLSASINVGGDTAFGFVGFGSQTGGAGPFTSELYKYYPPVPCISSFPSEVNSINQNAYLTVNPNPVTDIINIKSSSETVNYQLCDMFGKTVIQSINAQNEFEINTAYLNSGVYLLKIIYSNGQTEVRKISKI